jgi:threonine synthase
LAKPGFLLSLPRSGIRRAPGSPQQGLHQPDEPALVLCTGSGLKDINAAMRAVEPAPIIEPTLNKLKEALHV